MQSAEMETLLEKATRVAATSPRAVFKTAVRAACVILFASSVLNFDTILSRQRPGFEDDLGRPPSVRDVGPPLPYAVVKMGLRRGLLRDGALDALTSTNSYGLFRTLTGEAQSFGPVDASYFILFGTDSALHNWLTKQG